MATVADNRVVTTNTQTNNQSPLYKALSQADTKAYEVYQQVKPLAIATYKRAMEALSQAWNTMKKVNPIKTMKDLENSLVATLAVSCILTLALYNALLIDLLIMI